MSTAPTPGLTPARIFESLLAHQQSCALNAAIELDIFTAIAEGATTAAEIGARSNASERGVRILCDYLITHGFLTGKTNNYACSPEAAVFLNRKSPAYLGTTARFLFGEFPLADWPKLTDSVRKGGTFRHGQGTVEADNPTWVVFARAMAPMAHMNAKVMAERVAGSGPKKVLDIAAGHGLYGISIAQLNPQAEVVAQDWAAVLEVAAENAAAAGVADRFKTLPGSAFEVDFGSGFDLILLTNFLHHFDVATNDLLLRKVHEALAPEGKAVACEFVPNEDRVTPAFPARFALMMLHSTPAGDAYTLREYDSMFREAGFSGTESFILPTQQSMIISTK